MSFEVCYSESAETINVSASNRYTTGDEFFDKISALVSKGAKKLEAMLDLCREDLKKWLTYYNYDQNL